MKNFDIEKMQAGLNAFLKEKYGDSVSVTIGANIIPADKLEQKVKDLQNGIDSKEETKQ